VTCDVVVFTMRADDLAVLLVQRKEEPFRGAWALPGGFVNENESLERAAARELYEETGLTGARLEQLAAFGDPGRDPRGHTVTVAYVTFVVAEGASFVAGDDAAAVEWHAFRNLALSEAQARSVPPPPNAIRHPRRGKNRRRAGLRPAGPIALAFDHARVVARAYRRLCRHLDDPVRDPAFDVVPPRFTLAELRRIYEVVGGQAITARTFKKHFVERGFVLPATNKPARNEAAQLYRWNRR
jgi:8-oxo-dGTP diphosphatase